MKQDLAALFGRFRDAGDTGALGRAFDECGAELLRVARHLGTSREDAEDLVQATFLTAIEKAGTLERGRDPMPWLVGILVLHSRNLRRKRGRTTELPELARHEPPDEALERAELRAKVADALQELPKRYAQVLAPYLAGEFSSGEIGALTGRAPGTVRMQIHRGLELLRRALGNTFFAWFVAPPQLRRVRSELLENACRARGLAVPATKVAFAPMVAAFAALALLVLGGVRWFGASAESATNELGAAATLDSSVDSKEPSNSVAAFSTGVEARAEPDRAAGSNLAQRGLRGRLVDGAGSPLPGIEVRLGVISIEWLNKPIDRSPVTPEVERSRCVTDSDGRFVLTGARRGDMHVLGIDCGGPRGHLHWIDDSPTPEGELELGDVSLGARVTVTGRVVDADGAPLAGVRVRPGLEAKGIRSFSSGGGLRERAPRSARDARNRSLGLGVVREVSRADREEWSGRPLPRGAAREHERAAFRPRGFRGEPCGGAQARRNRVGAR
jgi:RNA polymerase sigma-70 factor (ECF subfamily)